MNALIRIPALLAVARLAAQEPPLPGEEVIQPQPDPAVRELVGTTQQFRASGGDARDCGTAVMLAGQTSGELRKLTGIDPAWKVPVHLRLHGRAGERPPPQPVVMRLIDVDGARELRVDIHLFHGIDPPRLARVVVEALVHEQALAAGVGDSATPLRVPPWLTEGLLEAIDWSLERSDRRLYRSLFEQGGIIRTEELFETDDADYKALDAATLAAFRVSAGAMVMALLEQPQGQEGFRAFLREVPTHAGEIRPLLARHFPALNLSETSLAKWWALQLANKGGLNTLTDVPGIDSTEAALADALKLRFRTPEGIILDRDIDDWPALGELDEAARLDAVAAADEALVRLSHRCFPSYRTVLADYRSVLAALGRNETRDIAKRLGALAETRRTMTARAARGRDYLDWFEITRARETSGAFDDYLRLRERLRERPQVRQDPLSQYLDRMNRLFDRGASEVDVER
ncbi:MAG: hypothetical protein FJ385_08100 [Verrucomicrobia bacterium]|nr:hypothetical protein [Verrucomicrobiota bacterium]